MPSSVCSGLCDAFDAFCVALLDLGDGRAQRLFRYAARHARGLRARSATPRRPRIPMAQLPPDAGDVISVLQSRIAGVLTQRIVLKGDAGTEGENAIEVNVDQNDRRPGDVDGPVAKPTQSMIVNELDAKFPQRRHAAVADLEPQQLRPVRLCHRPCLAPRDLHLRLAVLGRARAAPDRRSRAGRLRRLDAERADFGARQALPGGRRRGANRRPPARPPGLIRRARARPMSIPPTKPSGPLGAQRRLAGGRRGSSCGTALAARRPRLSPSRRRRAHVAMTTIRRPGETSARRAPAGAPSARPESTSPCPRAPPSPRAPAANPLLAPLKDAAAPRAAASASAGDMPLPGARRARLAPPRPPRRKAAPPVLAPMPLPN